MTTYDGGEHGADLASKRGATTLQEAREVLLGALNYLERQALHDLEHAALASRLPDGSRIPEVHAALMHYYRQLQPHLVTRAEPRWTGEYYDEPITVVKIPTGPQVEGVSADRHRVERIEALSELQEWSMRTISVRREETRVFLSPAAVRALYDEMFGVQSRVGLHVQGRDGSARRSDGPSRI